MKILAALTIFWGSCLLFLVQPMIGNLLLPIFGGTAGVWIACLCAFQALLVVGYLYAHVVGEWTGARSPCRWLHVALLLGFAGLLSFSSGVVPSVVAVAILYAVVGANASLVQRLMASDRTTYRLYALSNIGSFVGLLVFPFVIEPYLPTSVQLKAYAGGVWVYAALLGALMVCAGKDRAEVGPRRSVFGVLSGISAKEALPWLGLSAVSCFVLDGLTSHLCNDVAPLPLLWCALLAIYLLTWSLAFSETGSRIGVWCAPVILVCLILQALHYEVSGGIDYVYELAVGAALLLFGCWHVQALLYRSRPDVSKLTGYYFILALGGAFGGLLATLAVPMAFDFVAEYPLAQMALLGVVLWNGLLRFRSLKGVKEDTSSSAEFVRSPRMTYLVVGVFVLLALSMWRLSQGSDGYLLTRARNFYGTTRIASYNPGDPRFSGERGRDKVQFVSMENNGTMHGMQIERGTWKVFEPTMYYSEVGGGMAVLCHPARLAGRPMRVALLGMGVGTMAYYGKSGDTYRFFEINPNVIAFARNPKYFTFLSQSEAAVEVKEGDARKLLEAEARDGEPKYDLIVVDVFSGDSIPAHLATVEAMRLYRDRLAPGGVIALHLTNWHLDLLPVVRAMAASVGLKTRAVKGTTAIDRTDFLWAYLSEGDLPLALKPGEQKEVDVSQLENCPVLTDDHHSLVRHLSSNPMTGLRFLPEGE